MSAWFGSWLTDLAEALVVSLLKAERCDHESPLPFNCGSKHILRLSRSLAAFEHLRTPRRAVKRKTVVRVVIFVEVIWY